MWGMTSTATSRRRPTAAKAKAATPAKALTNAEQNAEIGERLIEMIRSSGTLVWHSPYLASSGLPRSLSGRKSYSGINVWLLAGTAMEHGYDSPWWGTYRQISDLGGQVRKGESSTRITFWKILERTEADATGKPVTKKIPLLRMFNVFNAAQADWAEGLPSFAAPVERPLVERLAEADAIVDGYLDGGPTLIREHQDVAFYRPSTDEINLPSDANLAGTDERYATLFHEMVHSTGHATRLAREGIIDLSPHRRGSVYSFEELVAEFGSAFLCGQVGIDSTLANSAAYLQGWLSYLSSDPTALARAAQAAQKAVNLICSATAASICGPAVDEGSEG
jgi:antirestriction protein ArdC